MYHTIIAKEHLSKRLGRYLQSVWIILALAIIFVLQTLIFNYWFNITPQLYLFRLIIISLSLGIALYGPAIIFRRRGKFIYLLLVSVLASFVFISQFLYFSYSGAFLQISALAYAGLAGTVIGTIITLITPKLFVFLINILLLLIAFILSYRRKQEEKIINRKEKIIIFLLVVLIAISGYWFTAALEKHEWGDTSRLYTDTYDLDTLVGKLGIVNFTLEDTLKYILRSNQITSEDVAFLKQWQNDRPETTSTGKYFGVGKNRNVIIIQVESLENAVINEKINGQEITPNLNQLTREGLYFDNFYAQVGPGNTADTEFAVNNSLYPLSNDVAFINYAHNHYQALPQLLIDNGYHTYALHGDVPTFWNRSNIYPVLGYQNWFSKKDYTVSRVVGVGFADLGDEDFFDQSIIKLKTLIQPFMAILITLSSHTPFEIPRDLQTLTIPQQTKLNHLQQQYLESIHYADQALGKFVQQLKQSDLYDNSIIIIYGDHQSFTNISDQFETDKNLPARLDNGQVPLIILAPGTDLHGTTSTPSSQIDLYPTICNLLGIIPPQTIIGQDILNTKTPVTVRRNTVTGTINTILGSNIAYEASPDGVYENGKCLAMPDWKILPINDCVKLYTEQKETVKASDIIVRGNLLELLEGKK